MLKAPYFFLLERSTNLQTEESLLNVLPLPSVVIVVEIAELVDPVVVVVVDNWVVIDFILTLSQFITNTHSLIAMSLFEINFLSAAVRSGRVY